MKKTPRLTPRGKYTGRLHVWETQEPVGPLSRRKDGKPTGRSIAPGLQQARREPSEFDKRSLWCGADADHGQIANAAMPYPHCT